MGLYYQGGLAPPALRLLAPSSIFHQGNGHNGTIRYALQSVLLAQRHVTLAKARRSLVAAGRKALTPRKQRRRGPGWKDEASRLSRGYSRARQCGGDQEAIVVWIQVLLGRKDCKAGLGQYFSMSCSYRGFSSILPPFRQSSTGGCFLARSHHSCRLVPGEVHAF